MTGIVHPEGCRCPGCLPAQYVMKPATPSRSAATRRPATKSAGGGLIGFDIGCLAVLLGFAGISAAIGWLSRLPAVAWETIGATAGVLAVTWAGYLVITRPVRPPKGRLRVEASPQPPAPTPPPELPPVPSCLHLNAVPVDLSTGERVAWWCQECETQLGAGFDRIARPCCGSAHGDRHVYNCRHYGEWKNSRP